MRLPDRLLASVGFFARDRPDFRYGGTGFVISTQGAHGNSFLHIITAGHVAEALESGSGAWIFGMNDKSGNKILLKSAGNAKWWYHPTQRANVDCAVTLFAPGMLKEYDLSAIPEEMCVTEQEISNASLGVGDEINVVGLFTRYHGTSRHIPIVRSGNVAMMPTDPIPTDKYGPMEAYLVEGRSIGGLSGSPVFIRETLNLTGGTVDAKPKYMLGQGSLYLLGLMHGHWDVPVNFKTNEQAEAVNMGIAIVVPAKKILEVLNHPELVAMRKRINNQIGEDRTPTMDAALEATESFTKEDFEAALCKVSQKVDSKTP